jgi:hypothetical protein
MQPIVETVAGAGTSWTLATAPGTLLLWGSGIILTAGAGNDYTIVGTAITTVNSYSAGQLKAAYWPVSLSPTIIGADVLSPFALTTLQRVKDILFDPSKVITLAGAIVTSGSADVTGITVQTGKSVQVGQIVVGAGIPAGTTVGAVISATEIYLSHNANATVTSTIWVIDQPTSFDGLLIRYINSVTNYINNECGRFSFVQQTYVNDTYSITSPNQKYLTLRNTPVFPAAADDVHVTSFQWRAGTPSNPSWTNFIADQYELLDPRTDPISGKVWYPSGMMRIYGVLPRIYSNMIRVSYVGGYPVNWANPEDHNTHWLPADITGVCENMVVRKFKRRDLAGKSSEAIAGATISWRNDLDAEDKDVLGQYKLINW